MRSHPTLRDIAKDAGVSVTIAGRVLGGYGSYSEESRKKVLESARRLNYKPNGIARSLRSGKSNTIGVIVNSVVDSFWMKLFKGIESVAVKENYNIFLCDSDNGDPDKEKSNIETLTERNIDGLIMSPGVGTHKMLEKIIKSGVAVVLVESRVKGLDVPSVTVDDHGGAFEAVKFIIGQGHSRIGIIAGSAGVPTGQGRLQGYLDALEVHGVSRDDELIKYGDFSEDKAYAMMDEFLSSPNPPSAVFVCNESMTKGALRCMKDRDVRFPEDISIVGWDNPDWFSLLSPGITVVDQASYSIGKIACERLFVSIRGKDDPLSDNSIVIKPGLVVRGSCGRV